MTGYRITIDGSLPTPGQFLLYGDGANEENCVTDIVLNVGDNDVGTLTFTVNSDSIVSGMYRTGTQVMLRGILCKTGNVVRLVHGYGTHPETTLFVGYVTAYEERMGSWRVTCSDIFSTLDAAHFRVPEDWDGTPYKLLQAAMHDFNGVTGRGWTLAGVKVVRTSPQQARVTTTISPTGLYTGITYLPLPEVQQRDVMGCMELLSSMAEGMEAALYYEPASTSGSYYVVLDTYLPDVTQMTSTQTGDLRTYSTGVDLLDYSIDYAPFYVTGAYVTAGYAHKLRSTAYNERILVTEDAPEGSMTIKAKLWSQSSSLTRQLPNGALMYGLNGEAYYNAEERYIHQSTAVTISLTEPVRTAIPSGTYMNVYDDDDGYDVPVILKETQGYGHAKWDDGPIDYGAEGLMLRQPKISNQNWDSSEYAEAVANRTVDSGEYGPEVVAGTTTAGHKRRISVSILAKEATGIFARSGDNSHTQMGETVIIRPRADGSRDIALTVTGMSLTVGDPTRSEYRFCSSTYPLTRKLRR